MIFKQKLTLIYMNTKNIFESREYITKYDDPINDSLGEDPYSRTLTELFENGYINIDKDAGPTSHQVADHLKKLLNNSKTGHSGTLDPQVTGVLLCGLGKATRLMEYMLKSNKEYVCLAFFHKPISKDQILSILKEFTGEIMQMPPVVSAVKRELRPRTIYSNELLDIGEDNQHVLFRVACQHGTYIRKLCTDMGEKLEINCQMKELRRSKAGPIREEDNIIGLDHLRNLLELYNTASMSSPEKKKLRDELKTYIRPQEELLKEFKSVILRDAAVNPIAHGYKLATPGVLKVENGIIVGEEVVLFNEKGELIAMGEALMTTEDILSHEKGFAVNPKKVFVENNYYPRYTTKKEKVEK